MMSSLFQVETSVALKAPQHRVLDGGMVVGKRSSGSQDLSVGVHLRRREKSVAARAAVENLVLRCSLGAQLAGGWLPVVEEHPGPVAWSSAMARITLTNEIYSAYLICMCAYYMIGDRINYVICASQSDSMPAACCPLYAAPLLTGDLHDS